MLGDALVVPQLAEVVATMKTACELGPPLQQLDRGLGWFYKTTQKLIDVEGMDGEGLPHIKHLPTTNHESWDVPF
jgi:hypothetical protein